MLYLFFVLSIISKLISFAYVYRIDAECDNISVSSDQMLKSIKRKYNDYISFGKNINDTNAFVNGQLDSCLHTSCLEVLSTTAFLLFLGSVGVYYHLQLDEPLNLLFKCIWGALVYFSVCLIFDCRRVEKRVCVKITDYLSNFIGESDNSSVARRRREAFFSENEGVTVAFSQNTISDNNSPVPSTKLNLKSASGIPSDTANDKSGKSCPESVPVHKVFESDDSQIFSDIINQFL